MVIDLHNEVAAIEKAIKASNLGVTPSNDGMVIRLPFPELTEERRRDLVKQSGKVNEESKISIRNTRRNTLDTLKKAQKDGLPEDAEKDAEEKLQKLQKQWENFMNYSGDSDGQVEVNEE